MAESNINPAEKNTNRIKEEKAFILLGICCLNDP